MKKIVFLASLVCLFLPTIAQLSVQGTSSFTLDGTVPTDTVLVPLKKEGTLDWKAVRFNHLRPSLVRLQTTNRKVFADAVAIHFDSLLRQLVIAVDMRMLNRAGTYEVMVAYETSPTTQEILTFTLVRPAATLDANKPMQLIFEGDEEKLGPLVLYETGRLTNVESLSLSSQVIPGIANGELLVISGTNYKIKAGQPVKIGYTINQKLLTQLPLGKTTGKLVVTSPEVTTPVEVSFEILKKLSGWWIVFVTFLGLLVGFFVRVFLQQRKDLEGEKIIAYDSMQAMAEETKKMTDPVLRNEVNALIAELKNAVNRSGAPVPGPKKKETLTARTEDVLKRYEEAKKRMLDRLNKQKEVYTALATLFNDPGITADMKSWLLPSIAKLVTAKKKLDEQNPTVAELELINLQQDLKELVARQRVYTSELHQFFTGNDAYPSALSDDIKKTIKGKIEPVKAKLEEGKKTDTPEDIVEAVRTLDGIQGDLITFLRFMTREVGGAIITLRGTNSFSVQALRETYDEWLKALAELVHNAASTQQPDTTKAVDATHKLNDVIQQLDAERMRINGTDAVIPSLQEEEANTPNLAETDFLESEGFTTLLLGSQLSTQRYLLYSCVQLLLLTLIIGLFAYKSYHTTFVGTWDELITIFFFAFSLDLTVDTVLAKIKS